MSAKLTELQADLLRRIEDQGGQVSHLSLSRGEATVSRALNFHGLIARYEFANGTHWLITDAGRLALNQKGAGDE